MASLETYSENTYSTLLYLSLEGIDVRSVPLDHIASHVGKASGIATILRSVPYLLQKRAVILPVDVCAQYNVKQEDMIRQGSDAIGLRDAIFHIATTANDHLITARTMLTQAGSEAKGPGFHVLLAAVPISLFLERLERVNFDIFDPSLRRHEWKLPYRAYKAFVMRRI